MNASISALNYKSVADRAITIGTRINAWVAEAEKLESLPVLTAEQKNRLGDLGNALNSYDDMLADIHEEPQGGDIERALKAAN